MGKPVARSPCPGRATSSMQSRRSRASERRRAAYFPLPSSTWRNASRLTRRLRPEAGAARPSPSPTSTRGGSGTIRLLHVNAWRSQRTSVAALSWRRPSARYVVNARRLFPGCLRSTVAAGLPSSVRRRRPTARGVTRERACPWFPRGGLARQTTCVAMEPSAARLNIVTRRRPMTVFPGSPTTAAVNGAPCALRTSVSSQTVSCRVRVPASSAILV